MRVIMGQHSYARQFNLSPIAIIKKNLNHIVFIKDDILEIFDGSREKAVISPAPINANPGSHRQLIFCLWFHFIYLKQIQLSNKNEGEMIFSKQDNKHTLSFIRNSRVDLQNPQKPLKKARRGSEVYTQYVFIRNGLIRNSSEIFRIFKEQLLKILEIRNKFFY